MNIGRTVTVTRARNPQLIGKNGTVIDETKHTLTLTTSNGNKTLIKEHIEDTQ